MFFQNYYYRSMAFFVFLLLLHSKMQTDELKYLIALTFVKGIGPLMGKQLVHYFGNVEPVFTESERSFTQIPGMGKAIAATIVESRSAALQRADQEMEFMVRHNVHCCSYLDADYPYRLKECSDGPIVLYMSDNIDLNSGHYVAVVGTRKITEYGKELTAHLVHDLAVLQSQLTIVSGLAFGVDVHAHRAALSCGVRTVGVVAHGLDTLYPAIHRATAGKMCEAGGAIVTEYPMYTRPEAPNFVQRNRIVAGLCDAVVIVESAAKGGALITANAANVYNRDVFAFPGRVGDLCSEGCNKLIFMQKAALINNAEDLAYLMGWRDVKAPAQQQLNLFENLSHQELSVVECLRSTDAMQINELSRVTKMPIQQLLALLLQMEFKGMVQQLPGNRYKVCR